MTYPLLAICGLGLILAFSSCAVTAEPVVPAAEVIKLEHVKCADLRATLSDLDKGAPRGEKMVVVAHIASNSILLSGPREKIVAAKDLIARLDVPAK